MKHIPVSCLVATCCLAASVTACSDDAENETPAPDGGEAISVPAPDGGFSVARCRVLSVGTSLADTAGWDLRWSIGDSLISTEKILRFISLTAGRKDVTLRATAPDGQLHTVAFAINVTQEPGGYSPYVASVPDFRPAPGQFVNELPLYEAGNTQSDMNAKVLAALGGNRQGLVSLGGYGGYVVCGFDHTIVNVPGQSDFRVLGNAFFSSASSTANGEGQSGSCEPGIVMVAFDRNGNGLPDDDEWYELAGSEHANPATLRDYEIAYYRPADGHTPVAPDESEASWNTDAAYIRWTDNRGGEGWMPKLVYHAQDYYPRWIEDDQLTFRGTLLPANGEDLGGTGYNWTLRAFAWGYADNVPNANAASAFDIGNAVDSEGRPVQLPGIDFVKVYTGVRQNCGWLGETSTEVAGITDLHLVQP